jgi:hypothetical protein
VELANLETVCLKESHLASGTLANGGSGCTGRVRVTGSWNRGMESQNRFDSYHIAAYSRIRKMDEAQEIAAGVIARLGCPFTGG